MPARNYAAEFLPTLRHDPGSISARLVARRTAAPDVCRHGRLFGRGAAGHCRSYRFKNFREAFSFVQRAGELAEAEGHHPDIAFGWSYVTVSQ
jgi:hypothetical protein